MGTLVLHAGTGKAGSTSIQAWLARNRPRLSERGVELHVAQTSGEESAPAIDVRRATTGPIKSNRAMLALSRAKGRARQEMLDAFFEGLDAASAHDAVAVVTAEAMAGFFYRPDDEFLDRLECLGRRHRVRVAYYVRPQHTAVEAAWRQWGFRTENSPSEFVRSQDKWFRYFETFALVSERAPSVSFEPRPFRGDLLRHGDPAADFVELFLDETLEPAGEGSTRWNRGLPLDVVNVLTRAPPETFWPSIEDHANLNRIKSLLDGLDVPESENARASRRLLQGYMHHRFEPGNQRLIAALDWKTDALVPPTEQALEQVEPALDRLDDLWAPQASEAELAVIYRWLEVALEGAKRAEDQARRLKRMERLLAATTKDLIKARAALERLRHGRVEAARRRFSSLRARVRREETPPDAVGSVSRRLDRAIRRAAREDREH